MHNVLEVDELAWRVQALLTELPAQAFLHLQRQTFPLPANKAFPKWRAEN
jgi:hypothetical protein